MLTMSFAIISAPECNHNHSADDMKLVERTPGIAQVLLRLYDADVLLH